MLLLLLCALPMVFSFLPSCGWQVYAFLFFIFILAVIGAWYYSAREQKNLSNIDCPLVEQPPSVEDVSDVDDIQQAAAAAAATPLLLADDTPIINSSECMALDLPLKSSVRILNGAASVDSMKAIDYNYFRNLVVDIHTPQSLAFYKEYLKQLKVALHLKKNKYKALYADFQQQLKQLSGGSSKSAASFFSDASSARNTAVNRLEQTVREIRILYKELHDYAKSINIEMLQVQLPRAFTDSKFGLDTVVGRDEVKMLVVSQLYAFSKNPRTFHDSFQHAAFLGGSGAGKTKLARTLSWVYAQSGILLRNSCTCVTIADLCNAYVNESGSLTKKVLLGCLEGCLFIDEAYEISHHASESLTEIVNFIDKMMGLSIIIVAGYTDAMVYRFFGNNEGLKRRFRHIITLVPLSIKELSTIACNTIGRLFGARLDVHHQHYVFELMELMKTAAPDCFQKEAGDAENFASEFSSTLSESHNPKASLDMKTFRDCGIKAANRYLRLYNVHVEWR